MFGLGGGNGSTAGALADRGWRVTGVDPPEGGIAVARRTRPDLDLRVGPSEDDLAPQFGTFPAVVSLEVVEHVFQPRRYARCVIDHLEPGGTALISTPYQGDLKNLALAIAGKMEAHVTAIWDYARIEFWARITLRLREEAEQRVLRFDRFGRIPAPAKSMIAVARRPEGA